VQVPLWSLLAGPSLTSSLDGSLSTAPLRPFSFYGTPLDGPSIPVRLDGPSRWVPLDGCFFTGPTRRMPLDILLFSLSTGPL